MDSSDRSSIHPSSMHSSRSSSMDGRATTSGSHRPVMRSLMDGSSLLQVDMDDSHSLSMDTSTEWSQDDGADSGRNSDQASHTRHEPNSDFRPHLLPHTAQRCPYPNSRKARSIFTNSEVQILNDYFRSDPYPDYSSRMDLADRLKKGEDIIHTWFQNKRSRTNKKHGETGTSTVSTPYAALHLRGQQVSPSVLPNVNRDQQPRQQSYMSMLTDIDSLDEPGEEMLGLSTSPNFNRFQQHGKPQFCLPVFLDTDQVHRSAEHELLDSDPVREAAKQRFRLRTLLGSNPVREAAEQRFRPRTLLDSNPVHESIEQRFRPHALLDRYQVHKPEQLFHSRTLQYNDSVQKTSAQICSDALQDIDRIHKSAEHNSRKEAPLLDLDSVDRTAALFHERVLRDINSVRQLSGKQLRPPINSDIDQVHQTVKLRFRPHGLDDLNTVHQSAKQLLHPHALDDMSPLHQSAMKLFRKHAHDETNQVQQSTGSLFHPNILHDLDLIQSSAEQLFCPDALQGTTTTSHSPDWLFRQHLLTDVDDRQTQSDLVFSKFNMPKPKARYSQLLIQPLSDIDNFKGHSENLFESDIPFSGINPFKRDDENLFLPNLHSGINLLKHDREQLSGLCRLPSINTFERDTDYLIKSRELPDSNTFERGVQNLFASHPLSDIKACKRGAENLFQPQVLPGTSTFKRDCTGLFQSRQISDFSAFEKDSENLLRSRAFLDLNAFERESENISRSRYLPKIETLNRGSEKLFQPYAQIDRKKAPKTEKSMFQPYLKGGLNAADEQSAKIFRPF